MSNVAINSSGVLRKARRGISSRFCALASLVALCGAVADLPAQALVTSSLPVIRSRRPDDATVKKAELLLETVDRAKDEKARNGIAKELAALGPKVIPHLASRFSELEGFRQVVAAKALLALKAPSVADLLYGELCHDGTGTHEEIMRLLARRRDPRALPVYLKLLPESTGEVKTVIYYCLTYYTDRSCFDAWAIGMGSDNRNIRLYSYLGMNRLLAAHARAASPASDTAWVKKVDDLAETLIRRLGEARMRGDAPGMIRGLELLGLTGRERAADVVQEYLEERSPGVRATAAKALGGLAQYGRKYSGKLMDALDDSHLCVRLEATEALADLGETEAIPLIVDMLNTKNLRVRQAAVTALQRLSGKSLGYYPEPWHRWWNEQRL